MMWVHYSNKEDRRYVITENEQSPYGYRCLRRVDKIPNCLNQVYPIDGIIKRTIVGVVAACGVDALQSNEARGLYTLYKLTGDGWKE